MACALAEISVEHIWVDSHLIGVQYNGSKMVMIRYLKGCCLGENENIKMQYSIVKKRAAYIVRETLNRHI